MAKYILKRLAQSLLTIFLVVCVVFLLMRLLPNDYYFTEEQLIKLTDEQQHDILEKAGMLDHPLVQLGRYLKGILLHGDFGVSHRIQTGKSVTSIIVSRFGISMRLGLIALVFSLLIGGLPGLTMVGVAAFANWLIPPFELVAIGGTTRWQALRKRIFAIGSLALTSVLLPVLVKVAITCAAMVCATWRAAAEMAPALLGSGSGRAASVSWRQPGSCSTRATMRSIMFTAS